MVSFQTAFIEYLQKEKKYSQHTITAYSNDLNSFQQHNLAVFEQQSIEEVSYNQIRSWIIALSDQHLSNTTINRKIASLKAFYSFLLKTKQIQATPFLKHKALKKNVQVQIPFATTEMDGVFSSFETSTDYETLRNQLIVELLYATGIRRAELITLRCNNVDLANNTIKVLGKRNKERIIPFSATMLAKMKEYLVAREVFMQNETSNFLLVSKNKTKISESFVYRLIISYFSKVTQKIKTNPHLLRHTFATHLLNNGANLNAVKELLGHASLASTQVYTHNSLEELKKAHINAHPRNKE